MLEQCKGKIDVIIPKILEMVQIELFPPQSEEEEDDWDEGDLSVSVKTTVV